MAAGCAGWGSSWPRTREQVIDPIHQLLHHAYPELLEAMDRSGLAELFSRDSRPEALRESLALLDGFREVEHASGFIERVELEATPVRAWLALRVEGVGRDGRLRSIRQRKTLVLSQEAGDWRIASDPPTPLEEATAPAARFADEAAARGLWFRHRGVDKLDPDGNPRRYVYGSGVAAADVNGDGWDDVVFANGDRIELYLNEEGRFRNASERWGLGAALPPSGAILNVVLGVDLDNDGWTDLFVGAEFGQPLLLRGDGTRFRRVEHSGIRTTERTISASAADFDGDGTVDLFLANHEDEYREAPNPPWTNNAEPDQLFLNNGDGTFRDATKQARVGNRGWSLAPVAADYDLDGDVDLFVGNDFGRDVLFRNDGTGRFDEVTREAGVTKPVASMGADWGDWDADGDLDLFVGGMASNAGWVLEAPQFRIRKVPGVVDWLFRPYVRDYVRSWFRGNRFYENRGDGTFREIAQETGAQAHGWSWSTVWLDFDNDANLDLYALNGFISGAPDDDL
jgi:hypothetical protein